MTKGALSQLVKQQIQHYTSEVWVKQHFHCRQDIYILPSNTTRSHVTVKMHHITQSALTKSKILLHFLDTNKRFTYFRHRQSCLHSHLLRGLGLRLRCVGSCLLVLLVIQGAPEEHNMGFWLVDSIMYPTSWLLNSKGPPFILDTKRAIDRERLTTMILRLGILLKCFTKQFKPSHIA